LRILRNSLDNAGPTAPAPPRRLRRRSAPPAADTPTGVPSAGSAPHPRSLQLRAPGKSAPPCIVSRRPPRHKKKVPELSEKFRDFSLDSADVLGVGVDHHHLPGAAPGPQAPHGVPCHPLRDGAFRGQPGTALRAVHVDHAPAAHSLGGGHGVAPLGVAPDAAGAGLPDPIMAVAGPHGDVGDLVAQGVDGLRLGGLRLPEELRGEFHDAGLAAAHPGHARGGGQATVEAELDAPQVAEGRGVPGGAVGGAGLDDLGGPEGAEAGGLDHSFRWAARGLPRWVCPHLSVRAGGVNPPGRNL